MGVLIGGILRLKPGVLLFMVCFWPLEWPGHRKGSSQYDLDYWDPKRTDNICPKPLERAQPAIITDTVGVQLPESNQELYITNSYHRRLSLQEKLYSTVENRLQTLLFLGQQKSFKLCWLSYLVLMQRFRPAITWWLENRVFHLQYTYQRSFHRCVGVLA